MFMAMLTGFLSSALLNASYVVTSPIFYSDGLLSHGPPVGQALTSRLESPLYRGSPNVFPTLKLSLPINTVELGTGRSVEIGLLAPVHWTPAYPGTGPSSASRAATAVRRTASTPGKASFKHIGYSDTDRISCDQRLHLVQSSPLATE